MCDSHFHSFRHYAHCSSVSSVHADYKPTTITQEPARAFVIVTVATATTRQWQRRLRICTSIVHSCSVVFVVFVCAMLLPLCLCSPLSAHEIMFYTYTLSFKRMLHHRTTSNVHKIAQSLMQYSASCQCDEWSTITASAHLCPKNSAFMCVRCARSRQWMRQKLPDRNLLWLEGTTKYTTPAPLYDAGTPCAAPVYTLLIVYIRMFSMLYERTNERSVTAADAAYVTFVHILCGCMLFRFVFLYSE